MAQQGNIFNVAEPTGAEASAFQTTAAQAQAEAPNASISKEVEKTADATQEAAADVAHIAQAKGSALTGESTTVEQLKATTDKAVAEGQHDVGVAKEASVGYVQQARDAAGNLLGAAQQYLAQAGNETEGAASGNSTADTLTHLAQQAAAGTAAALGTAQTYLAAGQQATQNKLAGHEGATVSDAAGGLKTTAASVANTVAGHANAAANSETAQKASSGASSALGAASAYTTSTAQSASTFVQDKANQATATQTFPSDPVQEGLKAPIVQDTGDAEGDVPSKV